MRMSRNQNVVPWTFLSMNRKLPLVCALVALLASPLAAAVRTWSGSPSLSPPDAGPSVIDSPENDTVVIGSSDSAAATLHVTGTRHRAVGRT
jgi:hypothetical protein